MWSYLLTFALLAWPPNPADRHRLREYSAIAAEVADTDATPLEALTLVNIAAFESGFERRALGRHSERGAWQVMPPATSYGAREALRRLRAQGLAGYCGCGARGCPELVAHRSDPARLYLWAHDPPPPSPSRLVVR